MLASEHLSPMECVVQSVSCGSSHSVALLDCDVVVTFGRGEDGQLGHGACNEIEAPVAVKSLIDKSVKSVECGAEYTLAVTCDGSLYSWGAADFGRLGHGDTDDTFIPKPVSFFSGKVQVKEVSCGDTHTLVLTRDGQLYTFGRNQNGQLGLGHNSDVLSPQLVQAFSGQEVANVAGGAEHTIATMATGEVYAWGWGRYGNLGDGCLEDRYVPTKVKGLDGLRITKVACGWRHSVVVSDQGQLYTFGWSKYGQLGHGDAEDRRTPALVEALRGRCIVGIAGGWRHTMATDTQGTLWAWGWNKFGQLGLRDVADRNLPTVVPKLAGSRVTLLACGWRHTMVVTSEGQVFTWGRGVNGQLGHGNEEDMHEPTLLAALSPPSVNKAGLIASAAQLGGGSVPSDRFAVVPDSTANNISFQGGGQFDEAAVPIVPDMAPAGQSLAKKARQQ